MATGRRLSYWNPRLLRTIFLQLRQQQEAGLFCDVTLQGDGDGLHVHSCVIAACSPYLAELLRCPGKMSKVAADFGGPDLCNRRLISLGGIPRCYLFPLVRYMYTSELEVAPADVHGVLKAAKKLQIPELDSLNLERGRLVRHESVRKLNRGFLGSKKQTPVVHNIQHCKVEQVDDEAHANEEIKPLSLESINSETCSSDMLDNFSSNQSSSESNQISQATVPNNESCIQVMLKRTCSSPKRSPYQNGIVSNEQNKSSPVMLTEFCQKEQEEKKAICSVSGNGLVKRRKLNRGRMLNILTNGVSTSHGATLENSTIVTSTTEETEKDASQFMIIDGSSYTVSSNTKCDEPHACEKSTLDNSQFAEQLRHDLCDDSSCKEEAGQLGIASSSEIGNKDFVKDECLSMEGPVESSIAHIDLGGASKANSDLIIKCTDDKDLIHSAILKPESDVNKGPAEESGEMQMSSSELSIHEVEKVKLRKLKNGQNWQIVKDEQQPIVNYSEREEHLTELEDLLEQMLEIPSPSSDVDVGGCSPVVWLGEGVWPDLSSESDEDIDVLH